MMKMKLIVGAVLSLGAVSLANARTSSMGSCEKSFNPDVDSLIMTTLFPRKSLMELMEPYAVCQGIKRRSLSPCNWLAIFDPHYVSECSRYSVMALLPHLSQSSGRATPWDQVDLSICAAFGEKLVGKPGMGPEVCDLFRKAYLRGQTPCGLLRAQGASENGERLCRKFFRFRADHNARDNFVRAYQDLIKRKRPHCGTPPFETPMGQGACEAIFEPNRCDVAGKDLARQFCQKTIWRHKKPQRHKRSNSGD